MSGQTLGNYRIVEQIGLGGMATVYKAYDPNMDRYVAIKVLPQQFSDDPNSASDSNGKPKRSPGWSTFTSYPSSPTARRAVPSTW